MDTEALRADENPPLTAAAINDEAAATTEAEDDEGEVLVAKAQSLMDKITANPENPNPKVLHALSTILETEEAKYMETADPLSLNNARPYHSVGRLGSLIRENDELFELLSSKFLTESRYPVSVQAATMRLLFSCSLTWMYPHIFEDDVLHNIRGWATDEIPRASGDGHYWKHETGSREASDSEMLRTYSTGILAVCLACGGQQVEDVLTSGLSAKLMRYLRLRVLETNTSQRDANLLIENKSASTMAHLKTRDEVRGKSRQATGGMHLDNDIPRMHSTEKDLGSVDGPKQNNDNYVTRQAFGETSFDSEPPDNMPLEIDTYDAEADGEERLSVRDIHESKSKPFVKSHTEEDLDDARDDGSRRKINCGLPRSRGKGRSSGDGASENEQGLTSPCSGNRSGHVRSGKDKSGTRNQDLKRTSDVKKGLGKNASSYGLERDDNDYCFQGCRVGSKDFTDLVKKAVAAAETEAKAANAPVEAIKAAGDDAAEVVKTAAFEEYQKTNDEEVALLAASRAAATVVDAANAVDLARSSINNNSDLEHEKPEEQSTNEDFGEYCIMDCDSMAKLREKFSIQCLVILGEYVEVLGPVLHEKGVDVCLALLQRSLRQKEASNAALLLPDILKLISALAAHRKFAAVFVDRGGMQRLLLVPRNAQTFLGLSSCLFTIGSIQGIMERVCALPSNVVQEIVESALQLIQCPQDQARKNAALFFAAAFVFRAVTDAFDAQDGLQKLLNVLHDAASVRSGVLSGPLNNSGSLRSDRSPAEVLTSSEKQIAYHTCVALRQYFRAHLLLLVDSLRPMKNTRPGHRNISSARAAYKPLDISNEAMDAVFRQIQKDRKLGPAFVRARWPVIDKFLNVNGHITMLELCQAPPVERYLRDLLQYALGVLHIVTLVPYGRKPIVNAALSDDRVGIAVILDAVNGAGHVEPEIVEPALNLLINLVCPPPSISNKPSPVSSTAHNELRDRSGEPASVDRGGSLAVSASSVDNMPPQASSSNITSGLVGDRRISLGAGAGCAGLAAQLEQGYHQAREAVRSHNGIKILLQLLQPRMVTSPGALDCIRALTCRVLLGLARDDTIAHILTNLQVGKKLSELIRDTGSQTSGGETNRWQAELTQVAIELIGVVTNSGRASTLAASDAATPTLRRIERAAIAAATPISYHSRELLQLIHEHLQASGLAESATTLLKEAKLNPLPSLAAPSSLAHQVSGDDTPQVQIQWPSGRTPCGFLSDKAFPHEDSGWRCDSAVSSSKKKPLVSSSTHGRVKLNSRLSDSPATVQSTKKSTISLQRSSVRADTKESPSASGLKSSDNADDQIRTPIVLPMKRKLTDLKGTPSISSVKRLNSGENILRSPGFSSFRSGQQLDANPFATPRSVPKDHNGRLLPDIDENHCHTTPMTSSQHGLMNDAQHSGSERLTLDSIVVQYLKHQHRQCPAPITTLPPLSLLQPHVCPEPKRSLDAPSNVTSRLSTREFKNTSGGIHGHRKDRQFVYSRFRPWRTCRDDNSSPLTCISFLDDLSRVAVGGYTGELKVFDCDSNNVLESCTSHQSSVMLLQSHFFNESHVLLSSSATDVRLWDGSSISGGPKHSFDGIKSARFNNSGSTFAALRPESSSREILLYDVGTCQLDVTLTDTSNSVSSRGQTYSFVHFSPSDSMLLYNGVLWDCRASVPLHCFDQFTDYGGGGFHPAGNEVIINSEVWDLRNFRLLRSVPSLDQTVITFNASGDIIYAILRRNLEDVSFAFNTRRAKHPLFAAFRTVDAVNYSDIATIPVDRCVLDFATEPTDSFVGLVTMDDQDEMNSTARIYEIGRRKPADDDSDPDDVETEDDDDDEDEGDDDSVLEVDLDVDGEDEDDMSNDDDDIGSEFEDDDDDNDGDFGMGGFDLDENGILEIVTEEEDEDNSDEAPEFYSSGDEDDL